MAQKALPFVFVGCERVAKNEVELVIEKRIRVKANFLLKGKERIPELESGICNTVCVCVFFPSILDIKFVGRTSRGHTGGRSNRISHPPSFCGACLFFLARRIQPFLSLVDREVEFCVLTV